jgi:hypothetical protein
LEYFSGMSRSLDLSPLEAGLGGLYTEGLSRFLGMTREPGLDFFEVRKGAWA